MSHIAVQFNENPNVVQNLLPYADGELINTVGSWTVTSGNASLTSTASVSPTDRYAAHSLRVTPTNSDPVVLSIDNVVVGSANGGDDLSFHCRFYGTRNITFTTTLMNDTASLTTVRSEVCPSNRWSIVRGEPVDIPTTTASQTFSFDFQVEGHEGQQFYISLPTVYLEYAFTSNLFMREVVTLLPRVLVEQDSTQTYPTFPLSRLAELGTAFAGLAMRQMSRFRYRDAMSGRDPSDPTTLSELVDPTVCDDAFVPWLAQFAGIELLGSTTSTTAWGNLPGTWTQQSLADETASEDISIVTITRDGAGEVTAVVASADAQGLQVGDVISVFGTTDFNGTFTLTGVTEATPNSTLVWNDAGSATSESAGSVTHVEWIELETYDVATAGLSAYWRWQLENKYNGFKAGTLKSIEDSAKYFLNDTKACRVTDHYGGDRWAIHIETLTSETPGGTTGVSSDLIVETVSLTIPAGFTYTHECVASL